MMQRLPFNKVYDEHVDLVFNVCLNYLHNQNDAQEVTQDVFMSVHAHLEQFENRSQLKTWIYRIAINKCLDRLKKKKRKKRFGLHLFIHTDVQEDAPTFAHFDHPGVMLEDKEAVQRLFFLMDQLPERQKTVLLLRATEGLTITEIAEVMEVSDKAAESLLARARANLKKLMHTDE